MNPHAARVLDTVDQMLLEAGQEDAADLRAALLSLGTLAEMPVPAPGPKLAGMLSGTPVHTTRREAMAREAAVRAEVARQGARFRSDELARRRALRRNRSAVVSLTVMAGMGLGATSVAASLPDATDNHVSVQHLLEDWAPRWTIKGPSAAGDRVPTQQPVPGSAEPQGTGATKASDAAEGQGGVAVTGPGASGAAGNGKAQAAENTHAGTDAGIPRQTPAGEGAKPAAGGEQDEPEEAHAGEHGEHPANAGKPGAGQKASPGTRWLKKFNQ